MPKDCWTHRWCHRRQASCTAQGSGSTQPSLEQKKKYWCWVVVSEKTTPSALDDVHACTIPGDFAAGHESIKIVCMDRDYTTTAGSKEKGMLERPLFILCHICTTKKHVLWLVRCNRVCCAWNHLHVEAASLNNGMVLATQAVQQASTRTLNVHACTRIILTHDEWEMTKTKSQKYTTYVPDTNNIVSVDLS